MTMREKLDTDQITAGAHDRRLPDKAMPLRVLAAVAVLVSAGVHLYLWFDLFSGAHVVGPAFMVNAIGGVVIAILLVTWRHWIPSVLAIGFGVATLGAFIISTTAGLYGIHETWTTWEAWTAAIAEVVAIVTAGALLLLVENPLRFGADRQPHTARH
jgi:hypothetical protein